MGSLANISRQEKITSLELLEQINYFRKQEGNRKKLRHDTLIRTIEKEFFEEINAHKIVAVKYKDKKGEFRKMYKLTFNQARQILTKESTIVRKAIFNYIEKLEEIIKNHHNPLWLEQRAKSKEATKTLNDVIKDYLIPYKVANGSTKPQWTYKHYSELINKLVGVRSKERDLLDTERQDLIIKIELLFSNLIIEEIKKGTNYKDIQPICELRGNELINIMNSTIMRLANLKPYEKENNLYINNKGVGKNENRHKEI